MRNFFIVFLLTVLVPLGIFSIARAQAGSANYKVTCYSYAGTVVFEGQATSVTTSLTGAKIRQTNGKTVETLLATCVVTEQ